MISLAPQTGSTPVPDDESGAVEARIESLSHDGRGIARVGGKVTFIDGALPDETVRFRYLNRRRNYDSGKLIEVVTPSPDRVTPRCPHFGVCGGCSLQHLAPAAQLAAKQQVLQEQLKRLGQVQPETWLVPLSGPVWGYRRRARLGVRWVPKKGGVVVGFREKRKSFVADLDRCAVLAPPVATLLPALRALIDRLSCPDRIPQVEVAVGDADKALVFRHLVPLTEDDRALLRAFGEQHGIQVHLQAHGPESLEVLWPENPVPLYYRLPEFEVAIPFRPTDFIQVNAELNRALVHQALELLAPAPEDRVLDLFSGPGNFTLALARRVEQALGIEADAGLVAGARAQAARNGLIIEAAGTNSNVAGTYFQLSPRSKPLCRLNNRRSLNDLVIDPAHPVFPQARNAPSPQTFVQEQSCRVNNVEFRPGDLYDETGPDPWEGFTFNKLLLDPPRNGAREVIKRLVEPLPERIVYVSCHSATLARDAGYLVRALGYRLMTAGVVDMFPHTSHVESLALFVRT